MTDTTPNVGWTRVFSAHYSRSPGPLMIRIAMVWMSRGHKRFTESLGLDQNVALDTSFI